MYFIIVLSRCFISVAIADQKQSSRTPIDLLRHLDWSEAAGVFNVTKALTSLLRSGWTWVSREDPQDVGWDLICASHGYERNWSEDLHRKSFEPWRICIVNLLNLGGFASQIFWTLGEMHRKSFEPWGVCIANLLNLGGNASYKPFEPCWDEPWVCYCLLWFTG